MRTSGWQSGAQRGLVADRANRAGLVMGARKDTCADVSSEKAYRRPMRTDSARCAVKPVQRVDRAAGRLCPARVHGRRKNTSACQSRTPASGAENSLAIGLQWSTHMRTKRRKSTRTRAGKPNTIGPSVWVVSDRSRVLSTQSCGDGARPESTGDL